MKKHARYGPTDRYNSPPGAGMCISAFAVLKRGEKVLVGVPKRNRRWLSEWLSSLRMYSKEEFDEVYNQTRLPSTYLFEAEHPEKALGRVMRNQLGIRKYSVSAPQIMSYNSPSDWYPGNFHWDLAFVYRVRTSASPKKLPWWQELAFLDKREMRKRDFGWNNDFVKDLGLV